MKPVVFRFCASFAVVTMLWSCGDSAKFSAGTPAKPMTSQVTDEEVIFGVDKVFHIGDGRYPDSSCKDQIETYALTGNKYFFEFEILNPQTLVEIKINKICGIDYLLTNSTRIVKDNAVLQPLTLTPGTNPLKFQGLTLEPGKYAVVVESGLNFTEVRAGDHDDFLIGNISVKANKKIVGGTVRTE